MGLFGGVVVALMFGKHGFSGMTMVGGLSHSFAASSCAPNVQKACTHVLRSGPVWEAF